MTYKAQLVVRSRTKEGSEIIEKVKELASDQGKTYSEMAVELLGRGLNADDDIDTALEADGSDGDGSDGDKTDDAPEDASEDASEDAPGDAPEEDVDAGAGEPVAVVAEPIDDESAAPPHPKAPLPAEEAGPSVDPDLPPKEILKHYLERREERGERAAGRILVDFFAEAGPGKGGKLKALLKSEFSASEFDELMEPIKATTEYSNYRARAISQPSPYSEAK